MEQLARQRHETGLLPASPRDAIAPALQGLRGGTFTASTG
jgi:hypothetical protein